MRLLYMGTPDFAVPSLDRLVEHGYAPVAVVTGPDKRRGRGGTATPTAVKRAALEHGIEQILQPASVKDPAFAEAVGALAPDVIVVVAFRILPPAVFTQARLGAFNLHGSLLPRYRGAAPIHRAVLAGETETGVTTFFLKEKVDTGAIILKRAMPIGPDETTGDVHDRMMHLGAEAVLETVRRIEAGTAVPQPQDDTLATPAPKVFKEEAAVSWDRPASEVHNTIRGFAPFPAAWTMHDDTRLTFYRSTLAEGSGPPGTVLATEDRLVVACGDGAVAITEMQQPGRKRLPADVFLNGYDLPVGTVLG
ncbi:MAG: methionyl-tRNA formyltransferase [Bacteroidota bacterium]